MFVKVYLFSVVIMALMHEYFVLKTSKMHIRNLFSSRFSCILHTENDISSSHNSFDHQIEPNDDEKSNEFQKKLMDLAEPLLDINLITKTIEQWTRPLPNRYLSSPLVLVGPSGVGKGRLVSALLADYSKFFKKVVTHTTRNPRPDERHQHSYFFIHNHTFHEMVNNSSFVEWAKVHNNFYGTSLDAFTKVQNEGKISILEIDIQGAKSIKSLSKNLNIYPKYIFIKPPHVELLRERLIVRYQLKYYQLNSHTISFYYYF